MYIRINLTKEVKDLSAENYVFDKVNWKWFKEIKRYPMLLNWQKIVSRKYPYY